MIGFYGKVKKMGLVWENDISKQQLLQSINESLKILNDNYSIEMVKQEQKNHKVEKNFIKRIIKKLVGWYIEPTMNTQMLNNSETIHIFQNLSTYINALQEDIRMLENEINKHEELNNYFKKIFNITADIKLLENNDINYFEFENKYRGNRESIKNYQSYYTKYFKNIEDSYVLDIGCGRGEFLELLNENGIKAKGIDSYQPFIDFCKERKFNVEYTDALSYLNNLEDDSLNGIFMSQVIEHVTQDYAVSLVKTAYRKLKQDCYFILETPNPQNLSTYWNFYLDSSHIKPVHYLTLEYWFKSFGYSSIEKYHTKFSKCKFEIPHVEGNTIENKDKINESIDFINKNVFGYYDYTLIAKK